MRDFAGDWGNFTGDEGFECLPGSMIVSINSVSELENYMSLGILDSCLFYSFPIFVFQASEVVLEFCVFIKG